MKSKDEKRRIVKELLQSKTVLANYGNYRYYKIEDVMFDRECSKFYLDNPEETSTITENPTKNEDNN